jgi:valyl-tRNA synthetase
MPFITEELWQNVKERKAGESIMNESILDLSAAKFDETFINSFEACKDLVSSIRTVRNQKNIGPREPLTIEVIGSNPIENLNPITKKIACLDDIVIQETKSEGTVSIMVGTTEFALRIGNLIDVEAEIAKIKAELAHLEGFLKGVNAKLSNERFVANAPAAVVETERKKQSDATQKIATLNETLQSLMK